MNTSETGFFVIEKINIEETISSFSFDVQRSFC